MLVAKTVYRDGKAYCEVVEEEFRHCTLCGKEIEIYWELCDECEQRIERNQSDENYWNTATTK